MSSSIKNLVGPVGIVVLCLTGCSTDRVPSDDPRFNDIAFAKDYELCEEIAQYEVQQAYPSAIGSSSLVGFFMVNAVHANVVSAEKDRMLSDCLRQRGHTTVKDGATKLQGVVPEGMTKTGSEPQ